MRTIVSGLPTLDALLELVCVELQLSDTQDRLARQHYDAVTDWLSRDGSPLEMFDPHIFPQGSQRLGTTTRPVRHAEYDLDAVCKLTAAEDWTPGELYRLIWDRLWENGTYRPMMRRMPRCIRLEYAGNFHLDIAPAIPDVHCGGNCILVPDLDANLAIEHPENNLWKSTNPQGYAEWFEGQCVPVWTLNAKYARAQIDPVPKKEAVHAKPALKRSVQLLKRWRDLAYSDRPKLAPPSIILTTLSGTFYEGQQSCSDAIDSILTETICRMSSSAPLRLTNPAHSTENICEKWDQHPEAYDDFADSIAELHERWERLHRLRGIHLIERELSELFGESPVTSAIRAMTDRTIVQPRVNRTLHVQPKSGILLPAAMAGASLRMPPNVYHGDAD